METEIAGDCQVVARVLGRHRQRWTQRLTANLDGADLTSLNWTFRPITAALLGCWCWRNPATDNCSEVTITLEVDTVPGANAFDWSEVHRDGCGNTSVRMTITVSDEEAPVFSEELPEPSWLSATRCPQRPSQPRTTRRRDGGVHRDTLSTDCDHITPDTPWVAMTDADSVSHSQTVEVTARRPRFTGLDGVERSTGRALQQHLRRGVLLCCSTCRERLVEHPECDEGPTKPQPCVGRQWVFKLTYLVGVEAHGDNNYS